jgi:hypothetical protein
MTWRKVSTQDSQSVDVHHTADVEFDLDDCDTDMLLQALINRRCITEPEAEQILATSRGGDAGPNDITRARNALLAGNLRVAARALEDFLGPDFHGRITLKGR